MKTIVCFGDSIVEGEGDDLNLGGWVGRLSGKMGPHKGRKGNGWRVFNLGMGGDTIDRVFYRMGELTIRRPDVVVLGCGTNDIGIMKDGPSWQGVPEYRIARVDAETFWRYTIEAVTKLCPRVLVYGRFDHTEIGFARHEDSICLNAYITELCKEFGAEFITSPAGLGLKENLSHGTHPNAKGYDILVEAIYGKLTEMGWLS